MYKGEELSLLTHSSIAYYPYLLYQKGEKKELTGREAKNEQKKLRMERKMRKPEGELVFKVSIVVAI